MHQKREESTKAAAVSQNNPWLSGYVIGVDEQLAEAKVDREGARELQMNRGVMILLSMHKQAMLPICLVQLRLPIMLVLIEDCLRAEPWLGVKLCRGDFGTYIYTF